MKKAPTCQQLKKLVIRDLEDIVFKEICKVEKEILGNACRINMKIPFENIELKKSLKSGLVKKFEIRAYSRKIYLNVPKGFQVYNDGEYDGIPDGRALQIVGAALFKLPVIEDRLKNYYESTGFRYMNNSHSYELTITAKRYADKCNYWEDKLKLIAINERKLADEELGNERLY